MESDPGKVTLIESEALTETCLKSMTNVYIFRKCYSKMHFYLSLSQAPSSLHTHLIPLLMPPSGAALEASFMHVFSCVFPVTLVS